MPLPRVPRRRYADRKEEREPTRERWRGKGEERERTQRRARHAAFAEVLRKPARHYNTRHTNAKMLLFLFVLLVFKTEKANRRNNSAAAMRVVCAMVKCKMYVTKEI